METDTIFQKKIPVKIFLLFFIILPVVVDQLNGIFQIFFSIDFPFSQYLRLLYIIIGLLSIYRMFPFKFALFLILIFGFLIPTVVQNLQTSISLSNIVSDSIFVLKSLTLFLFFFVFYLYFTDIKKESILSALTIAFLIALGGLVFSFISKTGVSTYRIGIGSKGFFFAGNELSALFIPLFISFYYNCISTNKTIWILIAVFLGFLFAVIVLTKTIILSYCLIIVLLPFLIKYEQNKKIFGIYENDRKYFFLFFLIFILLVIILWLLFDYLIQFLSFLSSNKETAKNLLTFILSSRNVRTEYCLDIWVNEYSIYQKFFGVGWESFVKIMQSFNNPWGTTEIDFFDYLFSYGIIGILVICSIWYYFLRIAFRYFLKKLPFSSASYLGFLLLFSLSFISGHIFYSAMAVFYLSILLAITSMATNERG